MLMRKALTSPYRYGYTLSTPIRGEIITSTQKPKKPLGIAPSRWGLRLGGKKDEATDTYYYINLASGETRWDNPAAMDSSEDSEDDEDDEVDPNMVIENWRILVDQASERKYF